VAQNRSQRRTRDNHRENSGFGTRRVSTVADQLLGFREDFHVCSFVSVCIYICMDMYAL
jgi:hypothetical protein